MIDCEKCREMISCLLDSELDEAEAAQVRGHIAECDECRAVYEAFSAVSQKMRSLEDVPEDLHDKIMSGIGSRKQKNGGIVWLKYFSAAACIALVIFAGAKSGLLQPNAAVSTPRGVEAYSIGQSGRASGEPDASADTVIRISDSDVGERFAELIEPSGRDMALPEGRPELAVAFVHNGEEYTAQLYFQGADVFADLGSGAYHAVGSFDEIQDVLN